MLKYQDNSTYKNSYSSEKALYDAINNAQDLNEFKEKLELDNLAVKNAIALVKDQETARKKQFEELKEKIRLKAPLKILEIVDNVKTDIELVKTVSEIEGKINVEVSLDLMTDQFYSDFMMLENIEVYKNAEVPSNWQKEINEEYPQNMIKEGQKSWQEVILPHARNWDPNWNFDFDLIWEERHRRLIPVPDEMIEKRIDQFKKYRGI